MVRVTHKMVKIKVRIRVKVMVRVRVKFRIEVRVRQQASILELKLCSDRVRFSNIG